MYSICSKSKTATQSATRYVRPSHRAAHQIIRLFFHLKYLLEQTDFQE